MNDCVKKIKAELIDLETRLANAAPQDFGDNANYIADDFVESGSSGKFYSKSDVLEFFSRPRSTVIELNDFTLGELSEGFYILTYYSCKIDSPNQKNYRISIWRLNDEGWQMVFHKGEPL